MTTTIKSLIDNVGEVKTTTIGEICDIKTGKGLTKKDVVDNGKYPIISGGIEPLGFYNNYNRDENTITIARAGTAGYVNFIKTKFWVNDKCFSITPKENYKHQFNSKFYYYFLKNIEQDIIELQSKGSVPTINTQKLSQIIIPLPPPPHPTQSCGDI